MGHAPASALDRHRRPAQRPSLGAGPQGYKALSTNTVCCGHPRPGGGWARHVMEGYDDIDVEVVEMVEQALAEAASTALLPVDREDGLPDRPPEVAIAMIALERQHVDEEWL